MDLQELKNSLPPLWAISDNEEELMQRAYRLIHSIADTNKGTIRSINKLHYSVEVDKSHLDELLRDFESFMYFKQIGY